jgi:hydroxypyruvate reductase
VIDTKASSLALLRLLFDSAVAAVDPALCLPPHLPPRPRGRTVVVGAGKAAAAMARAVESRWDGPLSGLVITRYGHRLECERIEVVEASHPVPDEAGLRGARRMLQAVSGLTQDDLVLCLISGGGSALMTCPADGLTLADKQAVNRALLKCGASISEINCVRKHLSAVKGGRLGAECWPARVMTLVISDVPGDDPAVVASGPTVPDPTTCADAASILARYGIDQPRAAIEHLRQGRDETPKPGDPKLARCETAVIATASDALEAAARRALQGGLNPLMLGDLVEGEAREVAKVHAAIARYIALHGEPAAPPAVILSGGETTVTVHGTGHGGRNAEFLLALALALNAHPGVYALAADTDGIDGTEDNAGAVLAPDTLARAGERGLDAKQRLADNDAYSFFAALGDLLVTGPTLTNVNDFRAILVTGESRRVR